MIKIFLSILMLIAFTGYHKTNTAPFLHYVIKHPKIEDDKTPIVILLHGFGSNEQDLFSLATQLPEKYIVVSARAPLLLEKDSYAWYHMDFKHDKIEYNVKEAEESRLLILKFIEELKSTLVFDHHQIYLCGFSQGAILSYGVGLTNPDKVKGIAVMSGRLLEENKTLIKSNESLKKLKVFISHGTKDQVLDIHYARDANTYLSKLGIHAKYNEYPEGHTISKAMLSDLVSWLE